ncbi:MAG: cyclase family protein, partial [Anaerolineae bacterium]|nr:cyclase family protein [Anaerolineae bacterium]
MPIFDISIPISSSLVVWPGQDAVEMRHLFHLDQGDSATLTRFSMTAHTGTHLDAPAHFIRGGQTLDAVPLETLVGPALVVDTGTAEQITVPVLEGLHIPPGTERILF